MRNSKKNILFAPENYHSIKVTYALKSFFNEYLVLQNPKKYLICAWKLSLNEGNYALKIYGGIDRQKDSKTDRQTDKSEYAFF